MDSPPVHVTLVHGTHARNAAWVKSTSPMSRGLRQAGLSCESFGWTGRNSHRARANAARALADRLRAQLNELAPGTRQAVVAHSHGGNVAIHAVWRLLGQRTGAIPVVALATPFIFAGRRKVWAPVLAAGVFTIVLVFIAGLVALPLTVWHWEDEPLWRFFLFAGAWLAAAVQVLAAVHWWLAHGRPWRTANREEFLTKVQAPEAAPSGLLVIRAADDEASSFLAISQFAGWMSATVLRLARPRLWSAAFFLLAFAGSIFELIGANDAEDAIAKMFLVASNVAFFLCAVILAIAGTFGLSYGFDGPTVTLFAFVSAEATPPGTHEIKQRPVRDTDSVGLAHSSLYDDPQVIGWVSERLNRAGHYQP